MEEVMTSRVLITAAALVVASSVVATAGEYNSSIHERQLAQKAAIDHGRKDGGLTFLEGYRLRKEQARIAALEAKFKRDGVLTRSERDTLRQAQADASHHIYQERHDEQVRGWWWRTFVR
jgi:hypothetical protein